MRGWTGKTIGSSTRFRPSTMRLEAFAADVGLAVDRADEVALRRYVEALEDVRARARDRREQVERVAHDVADDLDPASHTFAFERRARSFVGREQQLREPVDLDPVALLGHREVAAAQSGLDVRERGADLDGRLRAGERRVRVAVDERPVGPLGFDRRDDRRLHRASDRPNGGRAGRRAPRARARRRRPATAPGRSAGRCGARRSSIPASRSASESGADLTNCGRFPTTERTFIAA